jgi:hypothetical protein
LTRVNVYVIIIVVTIIKRRSSVKCKCFWFGVLGAALAAAATASMVQLSTEDLARHAALVVAGTVEEITSYPPDASGVIYSDARVRVRDAVVGATSEDYVTVRYMGGEYEGLAFAVTVEPAFRVGEEVVLYLAPAGDGIYECPDGVQGKLSVVDGTVLPAGKTLADYLADVAAAAAR